MTLTQEPGVPSIVLVALDGSDLGGISYMVGSDDDLVIADLIARLQELFLDEFIGGGWPTCPQHHTHPLRAAVRDGIAVWSCPASGETVAQVGELRTLG